MVAVVVSFVAIVISLESTRVLIGAGIGACTLVFLLVFSLFVTKRRCLLWGVLS